MTMKKQLVGKSGRLSVGWDGGGGGGGGGGGEGKKSTSWTKKKKGVEQNKRIQEMTSHSPLFPLLPQVVQETVSGCRDTMGSALIRCSPPQWQGP